MLPLHTSLLQGCLAKPGGHQLRRGTLCHGWARLGTPCYTPACSLHPSACSLHPSAADRSQGHHTSPTRHNLILFDSPCVITHLTFHRGARGGGCNDQQPRGRHGHARQTQSRRRRSRSGCLRRTYAPTARTTLSRSPPPTTSPPLIRNRAGTTRPRSSWS